MRRSFFLFIFITCFVNMHAMQEVNPASESEDPHEIQHENPPQYTEIEIVEVVSVDHHLATAPSSVHSSPRDRRSRVIKLLACVLTSANLILSTTWALSQEGESMGPLAYAAFLTSIGACGTTGMYMALDEYENT